MTDYDPFDRGPHPVGVRSADWNDPGRDRTLPVEVWYPAGEEHAGRDLDPDQQDEFMVMEGLPESLQAALRGVEPAEGNYPLILFSHGFAGHRRQSTTLCTHWASHGYLVAAPDHVGNTTPDILNADLGEEGLSSEEERALVNQFAEDRPRDVIFVLNSLFEEHWGDRIDPDRIGMSGHSFGGWTTLMVTAREGRIDAALPMAPAGGESPLYEGEDHPLVEKLTLDWEREVPVLYLAAEFDSLIPPAGVRGLFERTPAPKRMVTLRNADHFHFCDSVEEIHELFRSLVEMGAEIGLDTEPLEDMRPADELCPGEHGYALMHGLGLAHMDAHVKGLEEAGAFLERDLEAVYADRGIDVTVE